MSAVEQELINAPYYHGFLTRAETDPILEPENGRFLVRLIQEENEYIYIVSVHWKGENYHYRIYQTEHKHYYFLNGEPKQTITALIRFHRFTQTPVDEKTGARLRRFVKRSHYALFREQLSIGKSLGNGEFGEVFKGKLRLGIWTTVDVAIKQMQVPTDSEVNPNERIKFLREANLMMRLKHRNIVRLYGVVIYNDPIFIVTEFAPSGDLFTRLISKTNPPTRAERKQYCADICFGMAYLERNKIIHRDLAARNCLIGQGNIAKVADFGLSFVRMDKMTKVHLRKVRVPIRYIPPETMREAVFSHKSDVWSYGVTLYEIWSDPYIEPYHEIQDNRKLRKAVVDGLRLTPPAGMPATMKKLMLRTHTTDADQRPTFEQIRNANFGAEKVPIQELIQDCLNVMQIGRFDAFDSSYYVA